MVGSSIILKTTDGGATTWSTQTTAPHALKSVDCPDVNTCYAVGSPGLILKTTDGGSNWIQQNPPSGNFNSVECLDVNTCYIGGSKIFKTTDGGCTICSSTSWIAQIAAPHTLNSVDCLDVNTCYAVGSSGSILTPVELFQCGTGTILQGNNCVPDLDEICGDGTFISELQCIGLGMQAVGGTLLEIDTVAVFVAAIGVDPLITGLIVLSMVGVAGQAAWFVHRRKNKKII